jgi:hypothetical protein
VLAPRGDQGPPAAAGGWFAVDPLCCPDQPITVTLARSDHLRGTCPRPRTAARALKRELVACLRTGRSLRPPRHRKLLNMSRMTGLFPLAVLSAIERADRESFTREPPKTLKGQIGYLLKQLGSAKAVAQATGAV